MKTHPKATVLHLLTTMNSTTDKFLFIVYRNIKGTPRTTDTTAIGNQLRPKLGRWINIRKIKHQSLRLQLFIYPFFVFIKRLTYIQLKKFSESTRAFYLLVPVKQACALLAKGLKNTVSRLSLNILFSRVANI